MGRHHIATVGYGFKSKCRGHEECMDRNCSSREVTCAIWIRTQQRKLYAPDSSCHVKNHFKWLLVGGSVNHGEGVRVTLEKWEGDQQCPHGYGKNGVLEWKWEEKRGWIFNFWQGRHRRDHWLTLEDMWDLSKQEEMRRRVALIPGWPRKCMR
jgi:hypothetical protein